MKYGNKDAMLRILRSYDLTEDTSLFRYMSFRGFMEFVEMKQTSLSRVTSWPDTWEVPEAKLPIQIDKGRVQFSMWNMHQSMFGQCWTLLPESDAMWRIYSPHNEGVVIRMSVKKFGLLREIKCATLGSVIYYEDLKVALDQIYQQPRMGEYGRFIGAFLKRKAFGHEKEVRLVTADDLDCLSLSKRPIEGAVRFNLNVDPTKFIEQITIDPRADDRYVDVIRHYCERAGFSITPTKSTLYGHPHKQTRLVRRYVTVKKGLRTSP